MKIPERVNASWIDTLSNESIIEAEASLHSAFLKEEAAEKKRMGEQYSMMRAPESLTTAWMRWLMVKNEADMRGVRARHDRRRLA